MDVLGTHTLLLVPASLLSSSTQVICDNRTRRTRAAELLLAAARIPADLRPRLERCTRGLEPPLYLAPADAPGVVDAIASFDSHQEAFRDAISRRWVARRVRHVELAVEYREKQDAWVAYVKGALNVGYEMEERRKWSYVYVGMFSTTVDYVFM